MLIDWFTVIAQAINFLILVWLLKRFLYRPVLDAIDAREQGIAAKIADAEAKEAQAQKQRADYQQKNRIFDEERNAHMNQALEAAKAERAQLLDAARQESEDLRARLAQGLRNEQHSLNQEISRRARDEVFSIARKALSDLAGTSLELRMTEVFIDRLRSLDSEEIAGLKSAFEPSTDSLVIRTAFTLSTQQKADIESAVFETLGKQQTIEFIVAPELVSGIEISTNGRKIAWSLADYVDSLSRNVEALLKNTSASEENSLTSPATTPAQDDDKNGH